MLWRPNRFHAAGFRDERELVVFCGGYYDSIEEIGLS